MSTTGATGTTAGVTAWATASPPPQPANNDPSASAADTAPAVIKKSCLCFPSRFIDYSIFLGQEKTARNQFPVCLRKPPLISPYFMMKYNGHPARATFPVPGNLQYPDMCRRVPVV